MMLPVLHYFTISQRRR